MNVLPKLCVIFLISALSGVTSEATDFSSDVLSSTVNVAPIDLTDETFEHDTQAATGATTGDWFVLFYAPWCGFCKEIKPIWKELAAELKGVVNIAQVDAITNPKLSLRFSISGYPTLLLFHNGMMYAYNGRDRSMHALKTFVQEGYKKVEGSKVPSPPTMWTAIQRQLLFAKNDFILIVSQAKLVGLTLLSLCFITGFILGRVAKEAPSVPQRRLVSGRVKKDT